MSTIESDLNNKSEYDCYDIIHNPEHFPHLFLDRMPKSTSQKATVMMLREFANFASRVIDL